MYRIKEGLCRLISEQWNVGNIWTKKQCKGVPYMINTGITVEEKNRQRRSKEDNKKEREREWEK